MGIPGKDDRIKILEFGLRFGLGRYFSTGVHPIPHRDNGETLDKKLDRMYERIETLSQNYRVVILGLSAGASHAFLAAFDPGIGDKVYKGIGIGRYRIGNQNDRCNLNKRAFGAITFAEAVKRVDQIVNGKDYQNLKLNKFFTMLSKWDELVNKQDGVLPGVPHTWISMPEHVLSMAAAILLPVYIKKIVDFVEYPLPNGYPLL